MASWSPLCFLSGSITDAYLPDRAFEGPLRWPPFRIWGMMQVIDFFFFSISLLRAYYCIFNRCVSAQRLSIVSWCDQNGRVDPAGLISVFLNRTAHLEVSTGELEPRVAGGRWRPPRSFPSLHPPVPPSNPLSSFLWHKAAQLFMNVSSVLPALSIFPSLSLCLPHSLPPSAAPQPLSRAPPRSLLISLP